MKLPNPMRPRPINSILMGSENELVPIVLLSANPAVALTQKTSMDRSPVTGNIYLSIFFIVNLLLACFPLKPGSNYSNSNAKLLSPDAIYIFFFNF